MACTSAAEDADVTRRICTDARLRRWQMAAGGKRGDIGNACKCVRNLKADGYVRLTVIPPQTRPAIAVKYRMVSQLAMIPTAPSCLPTS
jgi:hypothetical protein